MDKLKANADNDEIQTSFSYRFFNVFQHSGDSIFLFPFFLILYLLSRGQTKDTAGMVVAGMLLTGLVVFILKQIFRKERPAGTFGKMYRKYDRFSFPSGHAARVWAVVTIISFFYWRAAAILSVWALLVSFGRLKLKLHHKTDVFAGVVIGILLGIFTVWVSFRFGFY
ncbi:MAG: phosphatase PAP2 family protein [Draconibacterium sp.]